jgi:actin-related protein 9
MNVAGFSIIERPLSQLYAANSVSGVVVDISRHHTEITPVIDSLIQRPSCITLDVGHHDCEIHLANMLRSNQPLMKAISPPEAPLTPEALNEFLMALAEHIWRDGLVKVPLAGELPPQEDEGVTDIAAVLVAGKEKAVIESNLKKKLSAKATAAERERAREIEAMDLIQIQFRGVTVTLGKERHRFCDPLFDPVLKARIRGISPDGVMSLPEAIALAVRGVYVDERIKAYDGLFVTGEIASLVKGKHCLHISLRFANRINRHWACSPTLLTNGIYRCQHGYEFRRATESRARAQDSRVLCEL